MTNTAEQKKDVASVAMKAPVSEGFITDVIDIACEGGINYWAVVSRRDAQPGGRTTLHIAETDENGQGPDSAEAAASDGLFFGELSYEKIAEGIEKLTNREVRVNEATLASIVRGVVLDDAAYIDAEGADVIIQCAALGDIVYG